MTWRHFPPTHALCRRLCDQAGAWSEPDLLPVPPRTSLAIDSVCAPSTLLCLAPPLTPGCTADRRAIRCIDASMIVESLALCQPARRQRYGLAANRAAMRVIARTAWAAPAHGWDGERPVSRPRGAGSQVSARGPGRRRRHRAAHAALTAYAAPDPLIKARPPVLIPTPTTAEGPRLRAWSPAAPPSMRAYATPRACRRPAPA
jgi:hypothetical protein